MSLKKGVWLFHVFTFKRKINFSEMLGYSLHKLEQ